MEPTAPGAKGDFHARIRQVETDLYEASYTGELNPEDPDTRRALPDTHLATSLQEAKAFVENLARSLDYNRVVWELLPD